MNLLVIDSSTTVCSATLSCAAGVFTILDQQTHKSSEVLLLNIKQLLQDHALTVQNLTALAFVQGPGSFTGLRIAASLAQGLSLGADLPLIALSSLELIAQQAYEQYGAVKVLVALDARMHEVYSGYFELDKASGCMCLHDAITLIAPELLMAAPEVFLAGNGFKEYCHQESTSSRPSAQRVAAWICNQEIMILTPNTAFGVKIARHKYEQHNVIAPAQVAPVYLRDRI